MVVVCVWLGLGFDGPVPLRGRLGLLDEGGFVVRRRTRMEVGRRGLVRRGCLKRLGVRWVDLVLRGDLWSMVLNMMAG